MTSSALDFPKADPNLKNSLDESCEVMSPSFVQEAQAKVKGPVSGAKPSRAAKGAKAAAAAAEQAQAAAQAAEPEPAPQAAAEPEVATPTKEEKEPGPGEEFEIDVTKDPNDSVGMDLDLIDGITPLVVATKAGTIQNWNEAHPKLAVKAGDKIHEVNGVRGDTKQIISTLKKDLNWRIVLQRPRELVLNIKKTSAPSLGLILSFAKNGSMLLVSEVNEGPVLDWNLDNPEFQVQAQDRIIELNGSRGNASELVQCSEGSDNICMKVLHYPNLLRYDSDTEDEEDNN